jgi:hypothetical protein
MHARRHAWTHPQGMPVSGTGMMSISFIMAGLDPAILLGSVST